MIKRGGFVDRFAKALYRRIVSSPPFETIDRPELLFPDLYKQKITIGHLEWQWGDLPNNDALIFLLLLAAAGYTPIVEFGTFRGRTTYNLALNAAGEIITVDIGHSMRLRMEVCIHVPTRCWNR